jgi:hypothetical protein
MHLNLGGQGAAVVAVHHPSSAAQLLAVMAGHRILVPGVEVIEAQAIAAVLSAGTVQIAPAAQVQAHMGATLWRTEEDQIPDL